MCTISAEDNERYLMMIEITEILDNTANESFLLKKDSWSRFRKTGEYFKFVQDKK